MKADIAVIGGGAAGMLAAAAAAEHGARVILLEKNDRLGVKLRITGKGRCNVTNACTAEKLLENISGGGKFLYSVFKGFTPSDTAALFESLGVPLKTERGNRVFPVSDKAADIADALGRRLTKAGVQIEKLRATGIETTGGAVAAVKTGGEAVECTAAILCTGGLSYPKTGSSGDGYRFAAALGHTVVPTRPSLVPLESDDEDCPAMQGLSLKNVVLTVSDTGGKTVFTELGEMQFTHFGVSGPLVLSASAYMRPPWRYTLHIDLKPGLDEKKLDARLLRDFDKYANRDFANALGDLAGRLMIPVLIARSGIAPETKVHSITKEQRRGLVRLFKNFSLNVTGTRPIDEAIITAGGVALPEINPKTMESKLVRGLYFAGEIIDADAFTGGFNLQIAWSTAAAAGRYAAQAAAGGQF